MRKIPRHSAGGLAIRVAAFLLVAKLMPYVALAQEVDTASSNIGGQPINPQIILPTQSSVHNQNSLFLPNTPSFHGQDVIRGAGGVSCESAIGSGGPYVDMGVIGSNDVFDRGSTALYGRVVVPLGKRGRRVDCTRLYELELARLRVELEMMRMGGMMVPQNPGDPVMAPTGPTPSQLGAIEQPPLEEAPREALTISPTNTSAAPRRQTPPTERIEVRYAGEATLPEAAPMPKDHAYAQFGAFAAEHRALTLLRAVRSAVNPAAPVFVSRPEGRENGLFKVRMGPLPSADAARICATSPVACYVTDDG